MNESFQVIVGYPNGERKGETYPFDDKESLTEGVGTLALIHLNTRDNIRRTFEVVRVAKEVTVDSTGDEIVRTTDAGK